MGIFSRIFKVAQSEAHSAVDNLENPIKMIEQGIRDLKQALQEAMSSYAQVRAIALRLKKDADEHKRRAEEYERNAMALLQRAQSGALSMEEAERLAREALVRKDDAAKQAAHIMRDQQTQQSAADQLKARIDKMRSDIRKLENESITLRSRAKTAESMKKVNRHLSTMDTSGTMSMLERMRSKIEQEESLAHAYGETIDIEQDIDKQINAALNAPASGELPGSDSLADLKRKMGLELESGN